MIIIFWLSLFLIIIMITTIILNKYISSHDYHGVIIITWKFLKKKWGSWWDKIPSFVGVNTKNGPNDLDDLEVSLLYHYYHHHYYYH
jgi:hypothetical protein